MKPSADEIVRLSAELLTRRFGGTQALSEVEELGGSGNAVVLRARVAPNPFLQQRSVVMKYIPATGEGIDDVALVREVVAYQFTNSLSEDVRPSPVLLAYDIDKRLIVLTDAGHSDTYEELLAHSEPEFRRQLVRDLGQAIGKMHAGTAGREDDFNVLLGRMVKAHPDTADLQDLRDMSLLASIDIGMDLLRSSGVAIPEVVEELAGQAKRRLSSGHHRAFTPFDLSPDNILRAERTLFLDYEWAGFRDATFDVACVIAGFPQFVSSQTISDQETDAFVEAWSREVREIWPRVAETERLHSRIVAALIGWALASVAYLYHGSMNQAVSVVSAVDSLDDFPEVEVEAALTAEVEEDFNLFTASFLSTGTESGVLARRDLFETFEALARFAQRGGQSEMTAVRDFARSVSDQLAIAEF
ncbi:phosphotransferase family protein [Corynebacterium epidermidicanis]|uniref:Phosphotransferase family protein n=2 Tax=Corynebacterium epidermidicanis TaxID=1050174 RepID=A0A0G3GPX9_9CORY|nr:phosphotransferase family protein [Corynebacterium epidermidicanis]